MTTEIGCYDTDPIHREWVITDTSILGEGVSSVVVGVCRDGDDCKYAMRIGDLETPYEDYVRNHRALAKLEFAVPLEDSWICSSGKTAIVTKKLDMTMNQWLAINNPSFDEWVNIVFEIYHNLIIPLNRLGYIHGDTNDRNVMLEHLSRPTSHGIGIELQGQHYRLYLVDLDTVQPNDATNMYTSDLGTISDWITSHLKDDYESFMALSDEYGRLFGSPRDFINQLYFDWMTCVQKVSRATGNSMESIFHAVFNKTMISQILKDVYGDQ